MLAHQRNPAKLDRRINATTSPTTIARTIATTEMTMVSTSPSRNGPLGVNKLFQKNCQSKCIRRLRSLADVQVALAPLVEDLAVGAVGLDLIHGVLNRVVQLGVSLQGRCTDLDGAERLSGHLNLRAGLGRVVAQRLGGVEVGIHLTVLDLLDR